MKNTTTFSLILLVFLARSLAQDPFSGVSGFFTVDSKPPVASLVFPDGGQFLNYLTPFTVSWSAADDSFGATPVSLGISTEPDDVYTLVATSLANTGSAVVTPPGILTTTAKAWVIATDSFGNESSDGSNAWFTFDESFSGVSGIFTLDSENPVVAITSPDGGETLSYVDPMDIAWTATDNSFGANPISLGISTDPGGAYTLVATSLANTGEAVVTPPGIITTTANAWVIATDLFGNETTDGSNGYFTFNSDFSGFSGMFILDSKPPVVNVISPNGGEEHYYADPLPVEWNATDDSFGAAPVTVAVSTDGGGAYNTVATGLANTGSASVTAPEVITNQAKVKVQAQDAFGLTAEDESDAVFTLQGIWVDLKAFLEGPYVYPAMLSYLNIFGLIPLSHPYQGAPWNYNGTESVSAIPNNDVVDWVLIDLRDAADAASAGSAAVVARQAAFILKNGKITATDGSSQLQFGKKVNQNLFAVVQHRNHLGVISANPLPSTGNLFTYDFTTGAGQVLGGVNGHKQIAPGVWGLYSGDGNADNQVNNADKLSVWYPQSGSSGYKSGDYNMDTNVNNDDKIQKWTPNVGRSSQVPG